MRSTEVARRRLAASLGLLALVVTAAAALGAPVRATYGARTTADEPQYLLTALSIARDGDLDISDELAAQRWRSFHETQLPVQTRPLSDGREVSPHDPLLPLLLAVPVLLGGAGGAKLALAAVAGLLAALTAWTAIDRFAVAPGVSLSVTAVFFCAAPIAVYGTQVYPELPAALATTGAVVALTGRLDRRGCWLLAVAVVALPWLAVKYAPVAAALAAVGLLRLVRSGRSHAAVGVAIALACAAVVFVVLHLAVWEGLTAYASGDHFVGGEFTAVGSEPNLLGRSRRLIGLLIDREFGLAAWQPAYLLAVPAAALLTRNPPPHWPVLAAPVAAAWLNATFVALTMHGYWFAGRQVVVVLPLVVLAVAVAADRFRGWFATTVVLGAAGVWSYAWLLAAGRLGRITWVVDFFDTPDPWYRAWSSLLPSYRAVQPGTWLRHGVWLAVLAAAALLAARRARRFGG